MRVPFNTQGKLDTPNRTGGVGRSWEKEKKGEKDQKEGWLLAPLRSGCRFRTNRDIFHFSASNREIA